MKTVAVYTAAEVAELLKVAPRAVNKWFDSKRLNGWVDLNNCERLIPPVCLAMFLREGGLAVPAEVLKQIGGDDAPA